MFNIIQQTSSQWTAENIAAALQDFVVCIEMFLFAIAHMYAFNINDFRAYENTDGKVKAHKVLIAVANLHKDIMVDTKTMITHYKQHTKNNVFKNQKDAENAANEEPEPDEPEPESEPEQDNPATEVPQDRDTKMVKTDDNYIEKQTSSVENGNDHSSPYTDENDAHH